MASMLRSASARRRAGDSGETGAAPDAAAPWPWPVEGMIEA
jgi:hypothetical protein